MSSTGWQSAAPQMSGGLHPMIHRRSALPTMPDHRVVPAHTLKSENSRLPAEGKKAVICYSLGGSRRPASSSCKEAQYFPLHLPAGEPCLPQELESLIIHCMVFCYSSGARRPASHNALPCDHGRVLASIQRHEPQLPHWGVERCNLHHNKNLYRQIFLAYHSLRESAETPE
jgi:hypothetical protein